MLDGVVSMLRFPLVRPLRLLVQCERWVWASVLTVSSLWLRLHSLPSSLSLLQLNISYPVTGAQKVVDIDDDNKL